MLNLNFQNGQAPALNARNMNAIVESINTLGYAVGGPNVASTVSAMTDTSKVYVYTGSETGYTAGNWYYYNGSAWVSGGVYQAAAVETDTTLTMPEEPADAKATGDAVTELKSAITYDNITMADLPYSEYHASGCTNGKYLNSSGEENTQSGWSISPFLILGETPTYYLKTGIASYNVKNCYYDSNREFLSYFDPNNLPGTYVLTPPQGAKFVRFTIQTADINDFTYHSQLFIDKVIPKYVDGCTKASDFKSTITRGKYYDSTGNMQSGGAWAITKTYPVSEGDVISVKSAYGQYATCFDEDMEFETRYTVSGTANASFTVPSGVAFVAFNVLIANLDSYDCAKNGVSFDAKYDISWLAMDKSVWQDKTYISHGDSITWRDGTTWGSGPDQDKIARGYQTIFSESVGLASYNNQGKSGWPMAVVAGVGGVVNTILAISDYTVYDLCTIACGTNDFKLNVPLGQLGIIGDTTFDDTTFYGAYRKAVEYILTNSPTIRLVLMTPLQRDNDGYDVNHVNTAGHKLIDYVNAVKDVGDMYGLPVCDMYGNSGFTKKTLATYTLDGLHPNTTGYVRMGNYLTGFLNAVGN